MYLKIYSKLPCLDGSDSTSCKRTVAFFLLVRNQIISCTLSLCFPSFGSSVYVSCLFSVSLLHVRVVVWCSFSNTVFGDGDALQGRESMLPYSVVL